MIMENRLLVIVSLAISSLAGVSGGDTSTTINICKDKPELKIDTTVTSDLNKNTDAIANVNNLKIRKIKKKALNNEEKAISTLIEIEKVKAKLKDLEENMEHPVIYQINKKDYEKKNN